MKRRIHSLKIGVTQTDYTGVTQTGTLGVTQTGFVGVKAGVERGWCGGDEFLQRTWLAGLVKWLQ